MAANYVRFYRGSPEAYANTIKNNDTLYFVYSSDSDKGSLYLGDRLISGNVSNITDLEDLIITELQDKQILQYDIAQSAWVNKSIREAIGIMTGAREDAQGSIGLVPAPGIGEQNLFLRGDGVWASPGASSPTDNKSITTVDNVLTLKDFGVKYYRYVEATGSEETGDFVPAHYEAQIVDDTHPWLEGLEPKVVNDSGNLVIGWFEPNLELSKKVEKLTLKVDEVNILANDNKEQIIKLNGSVNNIADLLNGKVDADNVYTKAEIDTKILEAGHLTRKSFNTLDEAKVFAESITNPEAYIYMVASNASETNKYVEYLYVEGALEQIGSWETDLSDYATKEEVNTLSTSIGNISSKVENLEEFMNSEYFTNFNTRLNSVETDLTAIKESVIWTELV